MIGRGRCSTGNYFGRWAISWYDRGCEDGFRQPAFGRGGLLVPSLNGQSPARSPAENQDRVRKWETVLPIVVFPAFFYRASLFALRWPAVTRGGPSRAAALSPEGSTRAVKRSRNHNFDGLTVGDVGTCALKPRKRWEIPHGLGISRCPPADGHDERGLVTRGRRAVCAAHGRLPVCGIDVRPGGWRRCRAVAIASQMALQREGP
jgi:hypothetical protein